MAFNVDYVILMVMSNGVKRGVVAYSALGLISNCNLPPYTAGLLCGIFKRHRVSISGRLGVNVASGVILTVMLMAAYRTYYLPVTVYFP